MMRPESGVEGAARGGRARKEGRRRRQLIEAITLWAPPRGLPGEGRKDDADERTAPPWKKHCRNVELVEAEKRTRGHERARPRR